MLAGRVREHCLNGGLSHRPPDAFGKDKGSRELPASGDRHSRDGEQVDRISCESDEPVPPRLVSNVAGNGTHAVTEKLARTRDDADGCGARSKRPQIGAVDTGAAFIGHVAK